MERRRIETPYRLHLVAADGTRTPAATHGVVIELGPGREVELDLAPHPHHATGLPITACPAEERDIASALVVRLGAANVIHLPVERRPILPEVSPDQPA